MADPAQHLPERGLRSPDPTSPTPTPPTCLPGSTSCHLPGSPSPRSPRSWLSPLPLYLSHPMSSSASPTSLQGEVSRSQWGRCQDLPRFTASCQLCLLNTPRTCACRPCPMAMAPGSHPASHLGPSNPFFAPWNCASVSSSGK